MEMKEDGATVDALRRELADLKSSIDPEGPRAARTKSGRVVAAPRRRGATSARSDRRASPRVDAARPPTWHRRVDYGPADLKYIRTLRESRSAASLDHSESERSPGRAARVKRRSIFQSWAAQSRRELSPRTVRKLEEVSDRALTKRCLQYAVAEVLARRVERAYS